MGSGEEARIRVDELAVRVRELGLLRSDAGPAAAALGIWACPPYCTLGLPLQGFKLHVSATILSAADVLDHVVPELLRRNVEFKVVATLPALRRLNGGEFGYPQIGKFITVYPCDVRDAVSLARWLDGATRGLEGPSVPSDRALYPESLIHYRWGGFSSHRAAGDSDGVPLIESPTGELIADSRLPGRAVPPGIADPFRRLKPTIARKAHHGSPSLFLGRFTITELLAKRGRGCVYRAVDFGPYLRNEGPPRACVLKHAHRAGDVDESGADGRDRLWREARLLEDLHVKVRALPQPIDHFTAEGDAYLVLEDLGGTSLLAKLIDDGPMPDVPQAVAFTLELCSALGELHSQGVAMRDLSPANVVIDADNRVRLVDLEFADHVGSMRSMSVGTPGYTPPERSRDSFSCSVREDVYAAGRVAQTLLLRKPLRSLGELVELGRAGGIGVVLDGSVPAHVISAVRTATAADPDSRFEDCSEFARAMTVM
ncbi:MAG: hypothetical protein QOG70_424 [Solirubrobacteraceae bacterium]|jgi:hypothetical protein|nr:hypothetical protein [Solirubrobacteraceae bacterium]